MLATIDFKKVADDEHFWNAFCLFDSNNDGFISASELKQALERANCEVTDEELDEIFSAYDVNLDRKIDFEEFKSMLECFEELPGSNPVISPVHVVRVTGPQRRTFKRLTLKKKEAFTNASVDSRTKST